MRVVLDTNVLIAAIAADGLCRDLVRRRVIAHDLITSEPLLAELSAVLTEKFRLEANDMPLFSAYRNRAEIVVSKPLSERVSRDRDDDVVLATAIAGKADVIVSGDANLLTLGVHAGSRLLSPRSFIEMLDRGA